MDEVAAVDLLARAAEPACDAAPAPGLRSASLAGSTAVVVLGMHRSGTSALTGVVQRLGVALGERLMPASPDNPRGYWEHADIVALHTRLMGGFGRAWDDVRALPDGFEATAAGRDAAVELAALLRRDFAGAPLWGVKDPRLCRVLPLWQSLLAELRVRPVYVLALRHPLDVAASLAARDGLGAARAELLWLGHVLDAERRTRGQRRTIVHYEDLIGDWRGAAARITDELGIVWPRDGAAAAASIGAYLAPELRRQRASDRRADGGSAGWAEAVHAAFRDPGADLAAVCDQVRGELERAAALFLPLLGEAGQTLAERAQLLARTRHEADELRAAVERLDGEVKALKQAGGAKPAGLPQPLPIEEAFPRWLAQRRSTALARADWVAERAAAWPHRPILALGMILPAGNELQVALTLRSLLSQTAGDWLLHVVAEGEMPAAFADPRVLWHREDGAPAASLTRRLAAAGADWVALIDAGDQLAPPALVAVADAFFRHPEWGALYSDEARIDPQGTLSSPHFKPDFNLDLMRSLPYVGGLLAVRRKIFVEVGGFDPAWDGTEEYDLALRLAERLGERGFGHLADLLYYRLTTSGRSRRPVEAICADMPRVLQAHLDRLDIAATAEPGTLPQGCRVRYHHAGPDPLVSIIVPTRNQHALLKRCVETVLAKTAYENYELIVVDNGSDEAEVCAYLRTIEDNAEQIGGRLRVLRHPGRFNFSALNNRAVRETARGDYLCLLNNDAAPLDPGWLGEMMMHARRPEVGVVGAKLYFPDGRIQHAGVILGVGWGAPADHPYIREPANTFGYWGRAQSIQDLSAVTAACLVTPRAVFDEVGGLDEESFAVSYNDVDYCLKVRETGRLVVWTPFAPLLHEGSASQRADNAPDALAANLLRFKAERLAMYRRWMPWIARDPAYNRNLTAFGSGFAVETEGAPTWDPEFRPRERVLVYPADREGCGEYRIIAPSRALLRAGAVHAYETMRLFTPPEIARMAPDSIVFQRQLELAQIDVIEWVKNTSPAFRVFEIDDLITNLPPQSPHRPAIAADIGERLQRAIGLCDRLVVSTEPLKQHYGRYCGETVVMPNRLEAARWLGLAPGRRLDGKPRVGWAGAVGHRGDIAEIAEVVEATANEVDWVFLGMCPDRLRRHVAEYHEWTPLHDYAAKLAALDLDLAVAPLEYHPFNEAKSNLRLLEYGVLGYPVLCTDILPYQGDLPVQRVRNRRRDWIRAVRDLVADRAALRRAGEELRAAVVRGWLLEDHLDQWKRAWLP